MRLATKPDAARHMIPIKTSATARTMDTVDTAAISEHPRRTPTITKSIPTTLTVISSAPSGLMIKNKPMISIIAGTARFLLFFLIKSKSVPLLPIIPPYNLTAASTILSAECPSHEPIYSFQKASYSFGSIS